MTINETSREQFRWPPRSRLNFYKRKSTLLFSVSDRDFDLSDGLMMNCSNKSRTVYMGVSTASTKWLAWDEAKIESIEELIKYDLTFDGYRVRLQRLGKENSPCSDEFKWKLLIREA
ncbi:MAG: hypothetical protein PW790_08370 [Parvibaculaceae bacterium]|nr:hypothetical protein [Parvibaculaceae bacterium]